MIPHKLYHLESNSGSLRSLKRTGSRSILNMSGWSLVSFVYDGHGFTLLGSPFAFSGLDIIKPSEDLVHSLEVHALGLGKNEVNRYL
jgi:hypothetical protein